MAGFHARIRRATGKNVDHLFASSLPERFSAIYRNRVWLNDRRSGSLSGEGSELQHTTSVRQRLPEVLKSIGTRTLLDAGCGDFNWMKEVQLPCKYIGVDIVPEVIEANLARYSSSERTFQLMDLTKDPLPAVDTVLCREVLFHLSFRDIWRVIENLHNSGASFLITTSDPGLVLNADILSGDFRLLNLRKAPFLFPPPVSSIPDGDVASGRILGVWEVGILPRKQL